MQPQENFNSQGPLDPAGAVVCPQCGSPMPREMRFCRSCGHRLGEGSAEYTETVRFRNGTTSSGARGTTPFLPDGSAPMTHAGSGLPFKRKRRLSGMTWVLIIIGIFFALGGVFSALRKSGRIPASVSRPSSAPKLSYVGVNSFENADGGVSFDAVTPAGSPADKAGLVGGDIITSFDRHVVKDEDDISKMLTTTPSGKTVEVIYIRDGETKKTLMTTVSKEEFDRLGEVFDDRPEGPGMFGFETDQTTRIQTPETKTYGLRLDYIELNSPADLAGVQKGDIITTFDNIPIRTADEMLSRVRRAIPKSKIELTVLREGQLIKIPMTMGKSRR